MTLPQVKKFADFMHSLSEETRHFSNAQPDDFFSKIIADNQEDSRDELLKLISTAEQAEAGNTINFRLIGPKANGSIMVDEFIKIIEPFNLALKKTAEIILFGESNKKLNEKARNLVKESLCFKIQDIKFGSTQIVLSGSSIEDTIGQKVFESVMKKTLGLLAENSESNFFDQIDEVGAKAAIHLKETISAVVNQGYSVQIDWFGSENHFTWNGDQESLLRVKKLLNLIGDSEDYEETITGVVASVKDTGLIEIRTSPTEKISVRYSISMVEEAQKLVVHKKAKLKVFTRKRWNSAAKSYSYKRSLISSN